MEGYKAREQSISVPKNTGVDGFLRTIKSILSLPRVQAIRIEATGVVQYTRLVRDGEPDTPLAPEYSGLEPWSIIRNGELEEVTYELGTPAPSVIAYMFNVFMVENLVPVAFATGAASHFWKWHRETAGISLSSHASAYGIPVYTDRNIPDQSLILCGAYTKGSTLPECHRFLSASMFSDAPIDEGIAPPETKVDVL